MVKRDTVQSLAQLRRRKQELRLEMEVTKREMAHGMGVMRTDLQSYLLKRVALPVGGGIFGLYLLKKLLSGKDSGDPAQVTVVDPEDPARQQIFTQPPPSSSSSLNLARIIKIAVPIIQAAMGFYAGYQKKEGEEES